ncbi:hypothetical protein AVP1_0156 [Aeromonas phage AVP1]|nr:hypothetical protein AVP1_0156 [Aeromonas phage AVP1]
MKTFNPCERMSVLHSVMDVNYTLIQDFRELGYSQFFLPLLKYNNYARKHLKETIAGLNVRGEFELKIGVVCKNQLSLVRNKQHKYSLHISDVYTQDKEIISLSGTRDLFNEAQINMIMTRLKACKYPEDLYYKHFEIIRSNIAKSLETDKPSIVDKLFKRSKNVSFNTGGYLEGKWIEGSYTAYYGLWGGVEVEGQCNYYVGMINLSMFSEIHTPVHIKRFKVTFNKDLKSLATYLAKDIAKQVCQELGPKF